MAVLPRSDALSRTRSCGASPQTAPPSPPQTPQAQIYSCHVCNKTSISRKAMSKHERDEHTTQEFQALGIPLGAYVCHICSRHFDTPKSLKMHSTKYHGIRLREVTPSDISCESNSSTVNSLLGIKVEPAEEALTYECSICYQICSDENALQEHFTSTHKEIPSPSTPSVSESQREELPLTKPECIYCFQSFKNNGGLVNHLRTAHGKPSCLVCLEIFATQEELLSHRVIHKNLTPAQKSAETPEKRNEEQPQLEAVNSEPAKLFTCDKCGKVFDRQISYARHRASHTRRGPSWVPQDILAAQQAAAKAAPSSTVTRRSSTSNSTNQNSQIVDVADSDTGVVKPSVHLSARKLKTNNVKVPYCLYCKKFFENYNKLWDHVRKVHPNNPRYKCPHTSCGRVFFGKPGYRSHLSTHKNDELPAATVENDPSESNQMTESNSFVGVSTVSGPDCFVCSKTFSNWNNLRRHFSDQHSSTPHFQCTYCKKFYRTHFMLNQHIKEIHPHAPEAVPKNDMMRIDTCKKIVNGKVKVYVYPKVLCRYCPKYLSKKYISEHEKIHRKAGLKPLIRNTPAQEQEPISNQSTMKEEDDILVVNDTSSLQGQDNQFKKKKKAVCKYCNGVFDSFKFLGDHLESMHHDKPYIKCDQCPEIYFDNQALKSHASCHNRSYKKCTYCDRIFAYHNYLKVHEKSCPARKKPSSLPKPTPSSTPTENQPGKSGESSTPIYTCDFCGAQFLETQLFVKHLQGHATSM